MIFTPHPYQLDIVSGIRQAISRGNNPTVVLSTGGGKTVIATMIFEGVIKKNTTAFFICHRQELLEQTSNTLTKNGIEHGFVASGKKFVPGLNIYVCLIGSMKGRMDVIPTPDLIVLDETHHCVASKWLEIINHFSSAVKIGLTATPERLDGKGLGSVFDEFVIGPDMGDLIEKGFLAKYDMYSIPVPDLSDVSITAKGEYSSSKLSTVMDSNEINGDVVESWKRYAKGGMTIGFAVNVSHSKAIVDAFNSRGIPAAHIDGTMKSERKQILKDFALGKYKVLFNVGLFDEGFDIAANSGMDVTVNCVIDASPTQSLIKWRQRCGRALRKQEGKAVIIDAAGNVIRHGLPCMHVEWSLDGKEKRASSEPSVSSFPIRQCPECFHVHATSPTCPDCGHVYTAKEITHNIKQLTKINKKKFAEEMRLLKEQEKLKRKLDKEQAKKEKALIEAEKKRLSLELKKETRKAKTIEELIAVGKKYNVKNPAGWARIRMELRMNMGKRFKY